VSQAGSHGELGRLVHAITQQAAQFCALPQRAKADYYSVSVEATRWTEESKLPEDYLQSIGPDGSLKRPGSRSTHSVIWDLGVLTRYPTDVEVGPCTDFQGTRHTTHMYTERYCVRLQKLWLACSGLPAVSAGILCFQVLTSLLSFALRQLLSLVQNLRMVEVLSKYPAPDAPHTWDHVALPAPKPAQGAAQAEEEEGLLAQVDHRAAEISRLEQEIAALQQARAESKARREECLPCFNETVEEVRIPEGVTRKGRG
jgi:hypothetical protein